jgi:hypothetical protein
MRNISGPFQKIMHVHNGGVQWLYFVGFLSFDLETNLCVVYRTECHSNCNGEYFVM